MYKTNVECDNIRGGSRSFGRKPLICFEVMGGVVLKLRDVHFSERVNGLFKSVSQPWFGMRQASEDAEEFEPGEEEIPRYPVISVHKGQLFAQERKSDQYICHVHCFIHNFSDEIWTVTNLTLLMQEFALESVEWEPTWPLPYQPSSPPFTIQPQGYIEFHTYFQMGSMLRTQHGELVVTLNEQEFRKPVSFSIISK